MKHSNKIIAVTLLLVLTSCYFRVSRMLTRLNVFIPSAIALSPSTDRLQQIKQRGYLIVAVKDNLRPLGFRDANGNLQGLEIDLVKRLAQDLLGKADAVKWQPVANRDRFAQVLAHAVDFTVANVTITESRARIVNFSLPYYLDGTAVVTKEPTVRQFNDLTRTKLAVLKGSSTIPTVRYLLPNAQLVGVDSYAQALSLLTAGGAAAFAADASVLSGWVQEYPQYRLLPTLLSAEPLGVVMPKGTQYRTLRQAIEKAIARYWAEGWLQQRANYWGLPTTPSRVRTTQPPRPQ